MPKSDPTASERRANLELRAVIDEMLERVRDFRRLTGVWTPAERNRAEYELERIMDSLRHTAVQAR
jgi:hypothetical protein